MRHVTRLALLGAVALGAAAFSNTAFAATRFPGVDPDTVTTAHFVIHYDTSGSSPISYTQASDVAALAEQAYAAELADGYPAPLSDVAVDGDPHIDLYVDSAMVNALATGAIGVSVPDNPPPAAQTSGYIAILGDSDGMSLHTIAHELFHLIQFGVYDFPNASDDWIMEGTAEWMGYRVDSYTDDGFDIGPDEMSLDCLDVAINGIGCSSDDYEAFGYSRWPFFEYLSETYGPSFVLGVFQQAASGASSAVTALSNALAAKGTTLANAFDAWTTVRMSASFTAGSLNAYTPHPYAVVQTGSKTANLPVQRIAVNHLAARYIAFLRGDGDASEACYAGTLSIVVAMPAGVLSKPTFYWNGKGSTPVQLSINGNTASASIPWDTCTWSANFGYLSLPNGSTSVDAAVFVVNTSLTVDTTTPANQGTAPAPITQWGQVVPVPTADLPPAVTVDGPDQITVAPGENQLRLVVESSDSGSLLASIGSTSLGTGTLVPGTNDIRYTLPASLLASVRTSADVSDTLTLTPVAASGGAQGTSVTRHIVIQSAAHTTKASVAKPKAKPASRSKSKRHK